MSKMRAMVVPEIRGGFRIEERELPEPGRHEVRVRVHACGVCHSHLSPSKVWCRDSATHAFPAMK